SPELDDDDDLFEDGDDEPLSLFDHPLKLGESTDQGRSSNQPKEVSVRERKGSKKISDESIESLTLKELKDKLIGLTGRQMWIRRTSGSWQKARLDEVYNNLFVKMVWDDWSSGEEMKKNLSGVKLLQWQEERQDEIKKAKESEVAGGYVEPVEASVSDPNQSNNTAEGGKEKEKEEESKGPTFDIELEDPEDKEADEGLDLSESIKEDENNWRNKITSGQPPTIRYSRFSPNRRESESPESPANSIPKTLTQLLNEAKCLKILESGDVSSQPNNQERLQKAVAEARWAEIAKLKSNETVEEKIKQLIDFLSETGETDRAEEQSVAAEQGADSSTQSKEAVFEELSELLGLDRETIEEIFKSQEIFIKERAKQEEVKSRSIKKRLGYAAARLGLYSALGIGGVATGGLGGFGAGLIIGSVRFFDRYASGKLLHKKITKQENELKTSIKNEDEPKRQEIIDNFLARLALAKQEKIDQDFAQLVSAEEENESFSQLSGLTIDHYLALNADIKQEQKDCIKSSLSALAEIDHNNQGLAEQVSARSGFRAILDHKYFKGFAALLTGKEESSKEKLLSAAIFGVAGAAAREVPLVRRALLALAGARAGELAGNMYLKQVKGFKEITADELKKEPDKLFYRARRQLLSAEFKKKSKQYYALKKQVEKMIEERVGAEIERAEEATKVITKDNKQLFKDIKFSRKALMASRILGAVGGVLLGEAINSWLSGRAEEPIPEEAAPSAAPEVSVAESVGGGDSGESFNRAIEKGLAAKREELLKDFVAEHRLLEQTGAEINVSPNGAAKVVYEIGRGKDFSALDQALRRLVVQEFDVGIDNQFDAVEAARAENVLANLRVLLGGNKIAGLEPEQLEGIVSFSDNHLEISNYGRFEEEILKPLFSRADSNIQTPDNVMEYVNRTSLARWQEMFNERQAADSSVKVDFSAWQAKQSPVGAASSATVAPEGAVKVVEATPVSPTAEFKFAWQPIENSSTVRLADFTAQVGELSPDFDQLNNSLVHSVGEFEVFLKDINGDGRPDAWLLKVGGHSLEMKIANFDPSAVARDVAATGNNIDNVAANLLYSNRGEALDFLSQAKAAGIEGINYQNFEPGSQFENLLNSFKGERLALLKNSHNQFDPSHFEIFSRLFNTAQSGQIERSLRLVKNLDWNKDQETAFGVLLAEPNQLAARDLMAKIFGWELITPQARLDKISDHSVVFKRLGGLGGKVELDFIKKKIIVGSQVLSGEIKSFKLNELAQVIDYLTNKQK
ncbi:MAG TPA: hypothetical protein PK085_00405, partial [bacterium]|nr:hypothetical protein [bacterium]